MTQTDKEKIIAQLKILIGKHIVKIGRIGATGNFSFCSEEEEEYVLRIGTSFRLRSAAAIQIANLDMFEPTQAVLQHPSFHWDHYNWDVQGANLYDE